MTKLSDAQKHANRLEVITNQLTAVGPQKRVAIVAVVFQKLIRIRAADENGMCICFTCDKRIKWNLKGTHAGHFISRTKLGAVFNPMNCHPQCAACNQHKGGSAAMYERRMRAKYGDDKVNALIVASEEKIDTSPAALAMRKMELMELVRVEGRRLK